MGNRLKNKAFYKHDCPACHYLGSNSETKEDYYYCDSHLEKTLISRDGEDGEYSSGLCFYGRVDGITKAGDLAIKAGLITLERIKQG